MWGFYVTFVWIFYFCEYKCYFFSSWIHIIYENICYNLNILLKYNVFSKKNWANDWSTIVFFCWLMSSKYPGLDWKVKHTWIRSLTLFQTWLKIRWRTQAAKKFRCYREKFYLFWICCSDPEYIVCMWGWCESISIEASLFYTLHK